MSKLTIVQQLLEKGADVDAATENAEAAISSASDHDQSEIIQMLLLANANGNTRGKDGEMVLQKAYFKGHLAFNADSDDSRTSFKQPVSQKERRFSERDFANESPAIETCDQDNLFLEESDTEGIAVLLDRFQARDSWKWNFLKASKAKDVSGKVEFCCRLAAKFKESMAQTRLGAIPQELRMSLAKVQQAFRTQMQESESHHLTQITAFETNISKLVRDELPSLTRRKVARQLQELLYNARIQPPPQQADQSGSAPDTESDEPLNNLDKAKDLI
ncbi:hypothetical protein MMC27_006042 [Xylographa pallens]|nr:hypothetical protein [Xylographa pallens]